MSRIIIAVSFDLKFDVLSVPPHIGVSFTDVSPGGQETHGRTSITDDASRGIWDAVAKGEPMLDLINATLDAQAANVKEPGAVAARITAADEADARRKVAEVAIASLDAQLLEKRAKLAELAKAPQS